MSDNKINFKIITPEKIAYSAMIDKISLPTKSGRIAILPGHTSLVSVVVPGEIVVNNGETEEILAIGKGVLEVRTEGEVFILADVAERVEDMDLEEILKAKARAEKILEEKDKMDEEEFAHFEDVLSREFTRLNIVNKYLKK